VLNTATAQSDLAWLEQQRSAGVRLRPRRDLAILAVQGPRAKEKFRAALADPGADAFIAPTGYTGEDGVELMLPAEAAPHVWRRLLEAGVRPCGLGARDTLRLEAGLNLYGQDMDASVTPAECGLAWTVSAAGARDFIGAQALLARPARFQRLGLVLESGGGVLRSHGAVQGAHGAGVVTSGSFSPTLQKSIALARLPLPAVPGERVQVAVRDKQLEARTVRPPFVRHGRILV
jgi:aminomethyltransferase